MNEKKQLKFIEAEKKLKSKDILLLAKRRSRNNNAVLLIILFISFTFIIKLTAFYPSYIINNNISLFGFNLFQSAIIFWVIIIYSYLLTYLALMLLLYGLFRFFEYIIIPKEIRNREKDLIKKLKEKVNGK